MKKLLAIVTLGGLFAATTLQAQVQIFISGSTAFRANAYRSIIGLYGNNLTDQNPGGVGANNSGATQVTLDGTIPALFGSQVVTIFLSWNGSAQGTHNLVNNDNISFLATATAGDTNLISHTVDLAFSDVFQSTTPFNSPLLVDTNVAVQPFCWVRSIGSSTNISNITMQQIQESWAPGFIPLSYFTGNPSDDASSVFFTGRNKDSGSRLTAAADAFVSATPAIFAVVGGAWVKQTTNFIANGVNYGPGFSSGGQEATTLITPASNGAGIGYLGYSDARTVVTNGGQIIQYNGQFPFANYTGVLQDSPDFTPIIKGQYSLWGYEHLFMRTGVSGNVPTFYSSLVTNIDNDIAAQTPVTAIRLSQMKVTRPTDGGPISP